MSSDEHVRIFEVTTKDLEGLPDSRGENVRSMLKTDHGIKVDSVRVIMGYQVRSTISDAQAETLTYDLFADPVIEVAATDSRILDDFYEAPEVAIQIGFKPGVTDNSAQAGLDGLTTLFPEQKEARVATYRTYAFWGVQGTVGIGHIRCLLGSTRHSFPLRAGCDPIQPNDRESVRGRPKWVLKGTLAGARISRGPSKHIQGTDDDRFGG